MGNSNGVINVLVVNIGAEFIRAFYYNHASNLHIYKIHSFLCPNICINSKGKSTDFLKSDLLNKKKTSQSKT